MKSTVFFEKGSVWKAIFKISLPTIAVMLVTIVYNMADLIFVGQTGDAAQVAAVSLASPFFLLQMTLGTLIGGGGCTAISTALGAKDTDRVKACSGACAALCLMSGVLLGSASDVGAALGTMFAPVTGVSFLVFTLLYTPCVAAITAVRRELGSGWKAAGVALLQCCVAWLTSFVVYHAMLLFV